MDSTRLAGIASDQNLGVGWVAAVLQHNYVAITISRVLGTNVKEADYLVALTVVAGALTNLGAILGLQ